MTSPSTHIGIYVERPAREVYGFASDPANLPRWAAGLASTVEQVDGKWLAETPGGTVVVAFEAPNELGVLDHEVTLPSGEKVYNPMRVIPHGSGCEVVFTLRRRAGMTDDDLAQDAEAVSADLVTLKEILEGHR